MGSLWSCFVELFYGPIIEGLQDDLFFEIEEGQQIDDLFFDVIEGRQKSYSFVFFVLSLLITKLFYLQKILITKLTNCLIFYTNIKTTNRKKIQIIYGFAILDKLAKHSLFLTATTNG